MTMLKAFECVDHNKLRNILQEMRIADHITFLLITCDVANLFIGSFAICVSSVKYVFTSFVHFKICCSFTFCYDLRTLGMFWITALSQIRLL